METNTKRCHGCKKELDRKLFDKSTRSADGLMSKCFTCEKKVVENYKRSTSDCVVCAENRVKKRACFGLASDGKKTHCAGHKKPEMIDLVNKDKGCFTCAERGVFKLASFGLATDGKKTHCSEHKKPEMIDLMSKDKGCITCAERGVFKRASFGLDSDGKKTHCSDHKKPEMIDLKNKDKGCITCAERGVFKHASFGLASDGKKTHCSDHKKPEMIDLVSKNKGCITCAERGVFKHAAFGLASDGKKTHCSDHKKPEMIDLVNKDKGCITCAERGVFKQAAFGLASDGKKTHCSDHKKPEMIDLVNKDKGCITCAERGVFKIASFGLATDGKKTHCSEHKKPEMIDLMSKNKGCITCAEGGVFKQASYGKLFEKKVHCVLHKKDNEFLHNNPKCEKCNEKPFWGSPRDQLPQRCAEHKKPTDIDMVSRECKQCLLDVFVPSNEELCFTCQGLKAKGTRKLKELKVARCLTQLSRLLGITEPVNDSQIQDGCRSRRRPDFYYKDFHPMFHLIVEVDEHQHAKYTCSIEGEFRRMIKIFEEDSGGNPILFVRFNPDPYYYGEKTISAYKGREGQLETVIKNLINLKEIDWQIGVIYLFYDNFEGVKIEPLKHTVTDGKLIVEHNHPHLPQRKIHDFAL